MAHTDPEALVAKDNVKKSSLVLLFYFLAILYVTALSGYNRRPYSSTELACASEHFPSRTIHRIDGENTARSHSAC